MKHWKETGQILSRAVRLAEAGRKAALATVVRIEGSAYRRPGAKFLVEEEGATSGGVSGGCLEADVREVALETIRSGRPKLLRYETGGDDASVFGLGLGCSGTVEIFVAPATGAAAAEAGRQILDLLSGDAPFAVSTVIRGQGEGRVRVHPPGTAVPAPSAELFVETLTPPPTLLVVGASDDAIPLCALAAEAGFRVTVVDHRAAALTQERFPGAFRLVARRPAEGTAGLAVGPGAFAVVKTHSFASDREWVKQLLAAGVPYVGLLGPRARGARILSEIGAQADGRVFTPAGLDLAAEGPEQIAIAIVAELLAVRSSRRPESLREKKGAIHAADVAGVVLAAGASTRFGRNKLLLTLEGESLVRRAARAALAAGLDPVVVVLGHEADTIRQELAGLSVRAVVNPAFGRGMNTSLAAGVAEVGPEAGAAVVLLADMPHVTAEMVARLVQEHRKTGAPLVASDYEGVQAPPTLYARALFPELGGPEGDGSGKRVLRRHEAGTVRVLWPAGALCDVDREEDWERVCTATS